VRAADIEFITQELPWAIVDKGYAPPPLEARGSGRCPSGGISYALVSGELPPGVRMSRLGYLSGVPTRRGSFEIIVRVTNGCTWTTKHFTLTAAGAPILSGSPQALEFQWSLSGPAPEQQVVHVTATWERLAYQATSNVAWLTSTPEQGFTRPQGSPRPQDLPRGGSKPDHDDDTGGTAGTGDAVYVRAEPKDLKPGRYEGLVTVSAWQAAEALRIPVVLTVFEADRNRVRP